MSVPAYGEDMSDLEFFFDPVCPFAWMTSKWVRLVAEQREYDVEWRFISLRLLNSHLDYDSHFPPEYEAGHTAGLRLLRVAASVRREHGPPAVAPLYLALGTRLFDSAPGGNTAADASSTALDCLTEAGLPTTHVDALEDRAWDAELQAETDYALSLTGKDVGTPILHVEPPHGTAFFGPVISRLPKPDEAVELWDHVIGLARFAGFAELKRSLRELPQLRALGVTDDEAGMTEDWHGGSRRLKK